MVHDGVVKSITQSPNHQSPITNHLDIYTMTIDPISLYQTANKIGEMDGKLQRRTPFNESVGDVAASMEQALTKAIAQLDQTQKTADADITKLVAGEPVDLHQVMLQMEESMLKLNLALQVRNKVIEAYQEIQRLQV
ncbi:flagellar hook-basal body complex protein FliE [bacterium]|nr:flagellar hook-basal body complex protein FliE [bacterium]